MKTYITTARMGITSIGLAVALAGTTAMADVLHLDDVIVDGSLCVGFDCVNGESFGFDTIRLKENNIRIKAQDTSATGSFPNNDWQITFNDSANGGANKFSIDDITGGKTPFTIEANAPSHSLYVDDGGRLGLGTATPVVDVHVKSGNTPTMRLEQDGSSGFTPQTWDVAGNEAGFFIRDVTNGSTLPFRIRPGAPASAIDIAADGDVGVGTTSPDAGLHVVQSINALLVDKTDGGAASAFAHFRTNDGVSSTATVLIEDNSASSAIRRLLEVRNNGGVSIVMQNQNSGSRWALVNQNSASNSSFLINEPTLNGSSSEFELDGSGNLKILGNFISGGTTLSVPDYVFGDEYELMPLNDVASFIQENSHLPNIPSAAEINENGINVSEMQMALLEKVEELTLYTLAQQELISELSSRLKTLEN